MRNKLPSGKMRSLYDPSFFRNPPVLWYTAGAFFLMMGLVSWRYILKHILRITNPVLTSTKYVPIYYIGSFSIALDITGPNLAFYLLPIMMAASAVGRIIPVSSILGTLLKIPYLSACRISSPI